MGIYGMRIYQTILWYHFNCSPKTYRVVARNSSAAIRVVLEHQESSSDELNDLHRIEVHELNSVVLPDKLVLPDK